MNRMSGAAQGALLLGAGAGAGIYAGEFGPARRSLGDGERNILSMWMGIVIVGYLLLPILSGSIGTGVYPRLIRSGRLILGN